MKISSLKINKTNIEKEKRFGELDVEILKNNVRVIDVCIDVIPFGVKEEELNSDIPHYYSENRYFDKYGNIFLYKKGKRILPLFLFYFRNGLIPKIK